MNSTTSREMMVKACTGPVKEHVCLEEILIASAVRHNPCLQKPASRRNGNGSRSGSASAAAAVLCQAPTSGYHIAVRLDRNHAHGPYRANLLLRPAADVCLAGSP
ncbi:MAG: hypothetical protein ACRYGK_07885 [Janthinobacterium lividum]